jgi:hypothetical protein
MREVFRDVHASHISTEKNIEIILSLISKFELRFFYRQIRKDVVVEARKP